MFTQLIRESWKGDGLFGIFLIKNLFAGL